MDEINILFRDFLIDKNVYNLNIAYWSEKLQEVLNINEISFDNNLYDGNPIFSYTNLEKKKAIRIIQENPEDLNNHSDVKLIEIWYDKRPLEIQELVISLYLTNNTVKTCMEIIDNFIN